MVAPAQVFAFGDTYDTPRQTMAMTFLLCTWGGTNNSTLRHSGGHFNLAFADGHSKAVGFKAGYINGGENGKFARPRATEMVSYYCANPDDNIAVNADDEGSSPVGNIPALRCGDIGNYLDQNFPACQGGSTSQCMMPE